MVFKSYQKKKNVYLENTYIMPSIMQKKKKKIEDKLSTIIKNILLSLLI